jgi:aminodeoxychorismate lyase
MKQEKIILNGQIMDASKASISINNRSFRYGDGAFETMKMVEGNLQLANQHMLRFWATLQQLQFKIPAHLTPANILQQITTLAQKNNHSHLARVRLTAFRGNGGLYDPENLQLNWLIQTWDLKETNNQLNTNGLIIGIYPKARKCYDEFSGMKHNNFLGYAMAALWAKENKLNDALLLNATNHITDSTIANIFIVQNGVVKTPALSEAPVNGIIRTHILNHCRQQGIPIQETIISQEELATASEVFLTNSIFGIRWVKQCQQYLYHTQLAPLLYQNCIAQIQ